MPPFLLHRYGSRPRNTLDIYLPPSPELRGSSELLGADASSPPGFNGRDAADGATASISSAAAASDLADAASAVAGGAPVVLFCHGGVWASGSKVGPVPSPGGARQCACLAGIGMAWHGMVSTAGIARRDAPGNPSTFDPNARPGVDCNIPPLVPHSTSALHAPCVTVRCLCPGPPPQWHYAPLATRLAQAGVITAVMSYTLYPDALIPRMVAEVGPQAGQPQQPWPACRPGALGVLSPPDPRLSTFPRAHRSAGR